MADWRVVDTEADFGDIEQRTHVLDVKEIKLKVADVDSGREMICRLVQEDEGDFTISGKENGITAEFKYNIAQVLIDAPGRGLHSSDLRDIPLSKIVQEYLTSKGALASEIDGLRTGIPEVPEHVKSQWPKGDKELVFEWVEKVYLSALAAGKPPTKTVGEQFGVSRSTGVNLVQYARKAGVLQVSSANDPTKRKKETDSGAGKTSGGQDRRDNDK